MDDFKNSIGLLGGGVSASLVAIGMVAISMVAISMVAISGGSKSPVGEPHYMSA